MITTKSGKKYIWSDKSSLAAIRMDAEEDPQTFFERGWNNHELYLYEIQGKDDLYYDVTKAKREYGIYTLAGKMCLRRGSTDWYWWALMPWNKVYVEAYGDENNDTQFLTFDTWDQFIEFLLEEEK
jgi:hypothetical protein